MEDIMSQEKLIQETKLLATPIDQLILKKRHFVTLLLALQVYPFYIAWTVYRFIPKMSEFALFGHRGASLPFAIRVFQSSHWWFVLPFLTTSLAAVCFHRRISSMALPVLVLVLTLLLSFLMQVMMTEATGATIVKFVTLMTHTGG